MKKIFRHLFFLFAAMLVLSCFGHRLHAATGRDVEPEPTVSKDASTEQDAGEEARKIRRLVKLALYPKATADVKQSLDDEIASVEKKEKFKKEVVKHLLQDDGADSDPTLPKIVQLTYRDGSIRGVLFIQADAERSAKPAELAWVIDSKREKKERGEH